MNEVRNQQEKESWKIYKFVEINTFLNTKGSKKRSQRKLKTT